MAKRINVIGGGIGGLATAWRLHAAGHEVHVYNASKHWGGVTVTAHEHDCVLELGPDSIIRTKPAAMQLIKELGIEDLVQETKTENRQALIARGKKLIPVPPGLYLMAPGRIWPFVCSSIVSWPAKCRMLLDLFLPRSKQNHDESLADFVRRRLGKEALERIAQPMVGGIYTADPEELSLRACMPQFIEMEQEHRSLIKAMMIRGKAQKKAGANHGTSGPRYGLFISLKDGLQTLIHKLCDALPADQLHSGHRVSNIQKQSDGWHCAFENGQSSTSDLLFLCGPAHAHSTMLHDACPDLSAALAEIPYADVATLNIGFQAKDLPPLPPASGFVVPAVENRNLIACTFSTNKYADRCPEDTVVLRAFIGGALQAQQLDNDDDSIIKLVLDDLKELCGITAAPVFTKLTRYSQAMAQPRIGHLERVARIRELEAQEPGLHLIGNGFEGVGIPDIIQQGINICDQLD